MLLIMIINKHGKLYRVYYDTKYDDWIVLTPKFGTTRDWNVLRKHGISDEAILKVDKRIAEVKHCNREGLRTITISSK